MKKAYLIVTLVSLVCGENVSHAEDWTQFRGPTGQGLSTAKNLPAKWSTRKNVVWKAAIPGKGWSSPVVWGPPTTTSRVTR